MISLLWGNVLIIRDYPRILFQIQLRIRLSTRWGTTSSSILGERLSRSSKRHERRHVWLVGLRCALIRHNITWVTVILFHVGISPTTGLRVLSMMILMMIWIMRGNTNLMMRRRLLWMRSALRGRYSITRYLSSTTLQGWPVTGWMLGLSKHLPFEILESDHHHSDIVEGLSI